MNSPTLPDKRRVFLNNIVKSWIRKLVGSLRDIVEITCTLRRIPTTLLMSFVLPLLHILPRMQTNREVSKIDWRKSVTYKLHVSRLPNYLFMPYWLPIQLDATSILLPVSCGSSPMCTIGNGT